jgi:hypothetical protein
MARSSPDIPAARSTRLRGCLRTIGERAFILIAEDRVGYLLRGNTKVFSRHTDEEVEVAGTASGRTPDDGPGSSPLQTQLLTSQPGKKSRKEEVEIPGLVRLHVSSLTPLAAECEKTSAR